VGVDDPAPCFLREIEVRLPLEGKVLDLGCGDNALSAHRTDRLEVWGADFEPHSRLAAPEWFRRLGPGGTIPFAAETFDLVAARWVLEHVESPARFLAEVRRVLRPGGSFVALTPHARHYVTWASRLLGLLLPHRAKQAIVRRLYGRAPEDTHPALYRLNSVPALERGAAESGLEVIRIRAFANTGYFAFWKPALRAAALLDRLLERASPGMGKLYLVAVLGRPDVTPPAPA
jgi:SAM-dependent methyltransferase